MYNFSLHLKNSEGHVRDFCETFRSLASQSIAIAEKSLYFQIPNYESRVLLQKSPKVSQKNRGVFKDAQSIENIAGFRIVKIPTFWDTQCRRLFCLIFFGILGETPANGKRVPKH